MRWPCGLELGARGLALVACAALASTAHAQPQRAQPVPLEMPISVGACVPVDVAAFRRQLAIELETAPQAGDLARAQTSARIELLCSGGQIKVILTDSAAHRSWRRRVDLRGIPLRAHTRLLALSVAELLLASWLERRIEDSSTPGRPPAPAPDSARVREASMQAVRPPAPDAQSSDGRAASRERNASSVARPTDSLNSAREMPPPQRSASTDSRATDSPNGIREMPSREPPGVGAPPPATPVRTRDSASDAPRSLPAETSRAPDALASSPRRLQLGAAGALLTFPSALVPLFGGELHVSVPLTAAWVLRAAAQGGQGHIPGELAQGPAPVRLTSASLALSVEWVAQLSAFELYASAGARLGLFHLVGSDTGANALPERAFAPWAGPLVSPGLRYRVNAWLHAALELEAGLLAVRVRALGPEQRVVAELHGAWLLLRVGLDLSI